MPKYPPEMMSVGLDEFQAYFDSNRNAFLNYLEKAGYRSDDPCSLNDPGVSDTFQRSLGIYRFFTEVYRSKPIWVLTAGIDEDVAHSLLGNTELVDKNGTIRFGAEDHTFDIGSHETAEENLKITIGDHIVPKLIEAVKIPNTLQLKKI